MAGRVTVTPSVENVLMERPAHVSHSQLAMYSECGMKYRLSYIDHVPREPSGPFIAGIAGHEAIAESEEERRWESEKGTEWIVTDAVRRFSEAVAKAGGPEKVRWAGRKDKDGRPQEDEQWWARHMLPLAMRNFGALRRLDDFNGATMLDGGAEMELRTPLPDGRTVKLVIDAFMLIDADGVAILRDHKLGKVGGADVKQLALYAWGVREALGITVEEAEFAYLRQAGAVKRHAVGHLLDVVPQWFAKWSNAMDSGLFPPEPSPFCVACSVRAYCPHGQTLEPVRSEQEYEGGRPK